MRRAMVFVLGAGMVVMASAGAAHAAPSKSTTTTAEAFWHFKKPISATQYQETTWYVGVFMTFGKGIKTTFYSDLYQDVELCQVKSRRCVETSSKYGDTELRGKTDSFKMDFKGLTTATLHGTYKEQSFNARGRPVGNPVPYVIDTTWTGFGSMSRNHQKFSFHMGCIHFSATTKGETRPAKATGTLSGVSLGTTRDTMFGGDATVQVDHEC